MTETPATLIDQSTAPQPRRRRTSAEAAFRVRVDEQLRGLEDELSEVKGRLNGLLFFIAGTFLVQAVLRVLG